MKIEDIRKRPVEVKGIRLTQEMLDNDFEFSLKGRKVFVEKFGIDNKRFIVQTLEGKMKAKVGDWLIIGIEQELYPCDIDIFNKTYEIIKPFNLTQRTKLDKQK